MRALLATLAIALSCEGVAKPNSDIGRIDEVVHFDVSPAENVARRNVKLEAEGAVAAHDPLLVVGGHPLGMPARMIVGSLRREDVREGKNPNFLGIDSSAGD